MFALAALLAAVLVPLQDPPPKDLTISGRVVDTQHRPVEGVELMCGGHVRETARDGSFSIPAEFSGQQILEIDARGLTDEDMPRVEPGARELEIVLPPRAFQTFRVLDDASGKPIERVEITTEEPGNIDWGPDPQEPLPE